MALLHLPLPLRRRCQHFLDQPIGGLRDRIEGSPDQPVVSLRCGPLPRILPGNDALAPLPEHLIMPLVWDRPNPQTSPHSSSGTRTKNFPAVELVLWTKGASFTLSPLASRNPAKFRSTSMQAIPFPCPGPQNSPTAPHDVFSSLRSMEAHSWGLRGWPCPSSSGIFPPDFSPVNGVPLVWAPFR